MAVGTWGLNRLKDHGFLSGVHWTGPLPLTVQCAPRHFIKLALMVPMDRLRKADTA